MSETCYFLIRNLYVLFFACKLTWTKLAAFIRHANLLAGRTRQWWTLAVVIESQAVEITVKACAFDAALRPDLFAMIVYSACAVQKALL